MSEALPLRGRVVAIIGGGSNLDRAIAVGCAEAGADIALGTVEKTQEQEFAANSIANEAWVIGRRHLVRVMDATEPTEVASFADEVIDSLGRCDVLVADHDLVTTAPLDELSPDEWERSLQVNLTGPYLAAQAFGRLMERAGQGLIVLIALEHPEADAAYAASKTAVAGLAGHIERAWGAAGVRVAVVRMAPGDVGAVADRVMQVADAAL